MTKSKPIYTPERKMPALTSPHQGNKKLVAVYLSPDEFLWLYNTALREDRTLSTQIKRFLREARERYEGAS